MKTNLLFYENETRSLSECGEPLVIELSSRHLGWKGLLLEKGWSPHFYPSDVVTPYFYFAMADERDLHWHATNDGKFKELKTVPGDIWMNPPWTPFTHKIDEACFFMILAIEEHVMLQSYEGDLPVERLQFLNNYNVSDDSLTKLMELFLLEVRNQGANGPAFLGPLVKAFSRYFINNYSNLKSLGAGPSVESESRVSPEQVEAIPMPA